jgi:CRP/FNR family transcriptional regulator, cyclic AMP receptor protein
MTPQCKLKFDPKTFLATIGKGRTITEYPKDETLFAEGDSADAIFYIQKGKVKLTVVSENGKEAIIAIFDAGDFLGEACLANQPLRKARATAMTGCSVMRIEKSVTFRVLHEQPAFSKQFLTYLLSRNIRVEADLVDQLFNSSEKRLARVLLLLANFGKARKGEPLIVKIKQETLAEMVGTTRGRISLFMNKFRRRGFIEYDVNGIRMHSSLLNVILHE